MWTLVASFLNMENELITESEKEIINYLVYGALLQTDEDYAHLADLVDDEDV